MKYGFIGCGNMGSAIASALATGNVDFAVSDRSGRAKELGFPYLPAAEIANTADRIFLGVKPQMLKSLFEKIAPVLEERTTDFVLVSMAAGVSMATISNMAQVDCPIIRIMPNMPVAVGEGMILYTSNEFVSMEDIEDFLASMQYAGVLDKIDEDKIDAASCVSGCGPAFAFMFCEALADGAVECGLPRDKALLYTFIYF